MKQPSQNDDQLRRQVGMGQHKFFQQVNQVTVPWSGGTIRLPVFDEDVATLSAHSGLDRPRPTVFAVTPDAPAPSYSLAL